MMMMMVVMVAEVTDITVKPCYMSQTIHTTVVCFFPVLIDFSFFIPYSRLNYFSS